MSSFSSEKLELEKELNRLKDKVEEWKIEYDDFTELKLRHIESGKNKRAAHSGEIADRAWVILNQNKKI
jgi:hypothetical protein